MNRVELIGRLATDVTTKLFGEIERANFVLAVPRDYTGRDKEQTTDFIAVTAWRQTAKFSRDHLKKGMRIGVCGRVESYTHQDANGKDQTRLQIIAERVEFADGKATAAVPQKAVVQQSVAPEPIQQPEQAEIPWEDEFDIEM